MAAFAIAVSAFEQSRSPVTVIDRAIADLIAPKADVAAILRAAISDIPDTDDATVRSDLQAFLERIPRPDADFKCGWGFVRARARELLLRLDATLRREFVRPEAPAVCYALPAALDLASVMAGATLDIYGYDFDRIAPEIVLTSDTGIRDVSAALVKKSHFHLAVDLQHPGLKLGVGHLSIAVAWNHTIHYVVPVVTPASSVCPARVETIPGRDIVVPSHLSTPAPTNTRYEARLALEYSTNQLEALVCVAARGADGQTTPGGCSVQFLETIDSDRLIESVIGDEHRTITDVQPSDDTSLALRIESLRVVSSDDNRCVSPIAYLDARRAGAIAADTRRSLDRQLRALAPDVIRSRPRYAPGR